MLSRDALKTRESLRYSGYSDSNSACISLGIKKTHKKKRKSRAQKNTKNKTQNTKKKQKKALSLVSRRHNFDTPQRQKKRGERSVFCVCEEQHKKSRVCCVCWPTHHQRHGVVVQRVPAIIDRSARVLPLALRRGRGGSHRESRERAPVAQKQPTRGDVRRAERRESGCVSKAFFFFFFFFFFFSRFLSRNSLLEFWNRGEPSPLVWTTTTTLRVLRPFWRNVVSRTRGVVCASKKRAFLFFFLFSTKMAEWW